MNMPEDERVQFPVLPPDLQVSFYYRLNAIRGTYLRDALKSTVSKINLSELDQELSDYVLADRLTRVASFGLRSEPSASKTPRDVPC